MAVGDTTRGRARPGVAPWDLEAGDYCVRQEAADPRRSVAWVVTPNGNGPARLDGWELTEHEDGSITVSPSILAEPAGGMPGWHGYLEHGVWREV